jgi:hypothetical protein
LEKSILEGFGRSGV